MAHTHDKPLRIAIGENHADLAESLSPLIELQDDMSPDLFILDLSLDDGLSTPLMKMLRSRQPYCTIIAFAGLASPVLVEQCLLAALRDAAVQRALERATQRPTSTGAP